MDLSKVKLIVNSGSLLKEEDSDTKFDIDPTESLILNFTTDITYKQIFLEVTGFINNNTNTNYVNNNEARKYLEYPKLYINSNRPNCPDEMKCEQCCQSRDSTKNNHNNSNNNFTFCLCVTKRRQIAEQLLNSGHQRQCMTSSLSTTSRQLFVGDKTLMKDSNEYKLNPNWFPKIYSYLKWQYEAVFVLLHNLVRLNAYCARN